MSATPDILLEARRGAFALFYTMRSLQTSGDAARAWGLEATAAARGVELKGWFNVDGKTLWIGNEIGTLGANAKHVLDALEGVNNIELFINSNGGDSAAALEIFRALRGRISVATIQGRCFSAGVTIAAAASRIIIDTKARMMLHEPRLFCFSAADDLRQSADYLDRLSVDILKALVERTKQPLESVKKWFIGDNYFTASEAVEAGLADEIKEIAPPVVAANAAAPSSQTDDEQAFHRFLRGSESIIVNNRERFFDSVSRSLFSKVKEQ